MKAKVLLAGEGLRASSQGVRLRFAGGAPAVTPGPFRGENELPAGFSILRVESLEQAIDWGARLAAVFGDAEVDVRPVTEAWDIGMMPEPPDRTTRRYMALRKATPASEAAATLPAEQRTGLARVIAEATRAGVHVTTQVLRPSTRGRRYKNTNGELRTLDGPFTESKELIAGYVLVRADSLDEACRWAVPYLTAVGTDEVDVRELDDAP